MHDSRRMTTQPTAQGWVPDDGQFGARLALVRQRMGWGNVKEAALACGLPVESWRGWERDGRLPRDLIGAGRAVAARTGCDLGWLIGVPRGDGIADQGPTAQAATHRDPVPSSVTRGQPCWPPAQAA